MANDRDYNRDEGQRDDGPREGERVGDESATDGERDIRTRDRGVERSDWSDSVDSDEGLEPSDERAVDEDDLEG